MLPIQSADAQDRSKSIVERPVEGLLAVVAVPDEEPKKEPALVGDFGKKLVEVPFEKVLAQYRQRAEDLAIEAPVPERSVEDVAKEKAEAPIETLVLQERSQSPGMTPAENAENPKVAPGKVNWHDDFRAAKKASRRSGKPVLHFQLLGQLDQRFT